HRCCRMVGLTPLQRPLGAADFLPVGTWLSLVEHSLGVRGVGSSNLPVPTIKISDLRRRTRFRFSFCGGFCGDPDAIFAVSSPHTSIGPAARPSHPTPQLRGASTPVAHDCNAPASCG